MVGLPIAGLIDAVMKKAGSLLIQQLRNIWDIGEDCDKLRRLLLAINDKLADAEARGVSETSVKSWLDTLKAVAYEADDVLDEFEYEALRRRAERDGYKSDKVRSFLSLENPLLFKAKMSWKLKDILKRIDEIVAEMNQFGLAAGGRQIYHPQTDSDMAESEIVGRQTDKEQIVQLLRSCSNAEAIAVLPIVGMGGVGKTTLAQSIYNDNRMKEHFKEGLFWVCVSNDFNVCSIVKKVIDLTDEKDSQLPIDNKELLRRRLHKVLSDKRCLLVLDDVWNEDDTLWKHLKCMLSCAGAGSAVIVTTRHEKAAGFMSTFGHRNSPNPQLQQFLAAGARGQCYYDLQHLNSEDSWTLFKRKAFIGIEERMELVEIGKKIVGKCGGLPLALTTLGGLLNGMREEREWSDVLASQIWDNTDMQEKVGDVLRLSYDHLPPHMKQCFAFCAVFPEDHKMDKEKLIQYWIANGFIPSEGIMDLEKKGEQIFNELVWRSFFQDVEQAVTFGECARVVCKMHDLMHRLARLICSNECSTMDISNPNTPSVHVRHLSGYRKHHLSTIDQLIMNFPAIRSLISVSISSGVSISISTSLRVLAASGYNVIEVPIKPRYMKHLRYLDLSNSGITELPKGVCELYHLQVLNLSNCYHLCRLPKAMRYMINLRHLYIDGCSKLENTLPYIGELNNLQTLTNYIVGKDPGCGIGELRNLNLGGRLQLDKLDQVQDALEATEANLLTKVNLTSLVLSWDLPTGDVSGSEADPIEKVLDISDSETDSEANHPGEAVDIIDSEADHVGEVLEALKPYSGLKFLEVRQYRGVNFSTWMADHRIMQNLIELRLENCNRCKILPPLWLLPSLEILYICDMDSLKHVYTNCLHSSAYGCSVDVTCAFPKLKSLELSNLASLEGWHENEERDRTTSICVFPHLEKMSISGCPKLTSMPQVPMLKELETENEAVYMSWLAAGPTTLSGLRVTTDSTWETLVFRPTGSLEELQLRGFKSVAQPTDGEEQGESSTQTRGVLTSISKLSISNCSFWGPSQIWFWNHFAFLRALDIAFCSTLVCWPEAELRSLNCLRKLEIYDCKGLSGELPRTPRAREGEECLPQLEALYIYSCNSLVEFPTCFPALRRLVICECFNLKSLPEGFERLTALTSLTIRCCGGLTSLPSSLKSLAELESLMIDSCRKMTSLPDGMQELVALRDLGIQGCPSVKALPEGLQQRLRRLERLEIRGCPHLQRRCSKGGDYWDAVSRIPDLCVEQERSKWRSIAGVLVLL